MGLGGNAEKLSPLVRLDICPAPQLAPTGSQYVTSDALSGQQLTALT
jgi:hypothetical protein